MSEETIILDNGSFEIKFGLRGQKEPYRALNCLTKDKYGNYHLSNQVRSLKDISSVTIRRPHELGQLTSWELEHHIWDYCFFNPDEFGGWQLGKTKDKHLIATETCMTIPELSKNMDQVVFEEYEFGSLFKAPTAAFVPFNHQSDEMSYFSAKEDFPETELAPASEYNDFQLVVDSGFNCTWIVPIIKGIPYYKAVKRLDIGGRFLNGLLKETLSFRHYNVMDETLLVNNIKQHCIFVSPVSYFDSFQNRLRTSKEYVLPDFHTSFQGYLRKRGQELPENSQTITLQDELFSVPETFFHPEVASLTNPGLIETILESISMVPETIRPLMVGNIALIGGNFNIPNFPERLLTELQRQCPTDWSCRGMVPSGDKALYGWESMCQFANTDAYVRARFTREEYNEHGADWCTRNRFGYMKWM
ncbi:LAMI_0H15478g1_1 [Lachancea mirantina]|uniref:Actin-like protein ARP6 n=1 Tax=Lachancea mirantina TaxID=1230905 RepID=A0A1G4KIH1_9SACH|nr:LAMI_0H15478g1_1 [Lachancea mirantina]